MKNRNNKKGFTLVELLVVIAIIAILATVSIVGYLSFTHKAKESNDQALVKQLNTVLIGNETTDGQNKTYSEAIDDMEEAGFNVDKMTPTATNNDILWDQLSDRFVLVKDGKVTLKDDKTRVDFNKKSVLWKMYDEIPTEQDYSIYLKGTDKYIPNEINLKTGFDAGKNNSNFKLFYNGNIPATERVIIKTNNSDTELRVNTTESTVEHYGNLGKTVIEQVPTTDCYHEFGKSVYTILTAGKLIMEENSKIEVLNVNATDETSVELEVNQNSNITKPYCENSTVLSKVQTVVNNATEKQSAEIEKDVVKEIDKTLAEENNADVQIIKEGLNNQYLTLEKFRDNVNVNVEIDGYKGYTIKLLKDVDLQGKEWTPIGTGLDHPFKGYFDGNNKTISNLTMNSNSSKTGLFGGVVGDTAETKINGIDIKNDWAPFYDGNKVNEDYFSKDKFVTSIKNLTIVNATIDNHLNNGACNGILAGIVKNAYIDNVKVIDSTVTGVQNTGGLIGWVYGTFDTKPGNTYTCISVLKNNLVENTLVNGETQNNGGLVGKAYDAIILFNNKVLGTQVSGNHAIAGLVGNCHYGVFKNNSLDSKTTITLLNPHVYNPDIDKYVVDYVAGGFCGFVRRTTLFIDCVNNASIVSKNSGFNIRIGGFVGRLDSSDSNSTEFHNCTNNAALTNEGCTVGEFVGAYHPDTSYQCPAALTFDEKYFFDSKGKANSTFQKIGQNGL